MQNNRVVYLPIKDKNCPWEFSKYLETFFKTQTYFKVMMLSHRHLVLMLNLLAFIVFTHVSCLVMSDSSQPQAPLSKGFSRQEYWSGLLCPPTGESFHPRDQTHISYVSCISRWVAYHQHYLGKPFHFMSGLCSGVSYSLQPHELVAPPPWDFTGKNTGTSCHFLLQGIFLTQGCNPCLLYCRQILYHCTTLHIILKGIYCFKYKIQSTTKLYFNKNLLLGSFINVVINSNTYFNL